jgi:hypothetical protein
MKNEVRLTSVNIIKLVYVDFKNNTLDTDMTLQKLVNRCVDLYNSDVNFRERINKHETKGLKDSKY